MVILRFLPLYCIIYLLFIERHHHLSITEGNMEDKVVKITIDANGNVHREIVDRTEPIEKKPKLLKRLVPTLPT